MKNLLYSFYIFILLGIFPFVTYSQNYFQQDVKYTIHVSLNDIKHELSANDSIAYTNNSPDDLTFLYFHLWPNAYKDNTTALARQLLEERHTFFYFSGDEVKGYIDSLDFKVNGKTVTWKLDSNNIDICKIFLNEPLKPGQTIFITSPFHVKLPDSKISRLGHDGQSYQISQWFPKPAVYDMNGWNQFPFLDQGEFYSEFGTFDVYITLPENYVVGATGDLVNGQKELDWLDSIADKTSRIKSFDKKDIAFPPSSRQNKTLHYHQEKVHDFAWFADKRYHVAKDYAELPFSGKRVSTWAMFTNRHADIWKDGAKYVSSAIYYYSKWVGEYPYKQATAVEGALSAGGGMEYPNVTVISSGGDAESLEMVIVHEVGHNWFYGLLGSNERKDPWMDEGINSFYEYRYQQMMHPGSAEYLNMAKKFIHIPPHPERVERIMLYEVASHINNDQPITLPAPIFSTTNYGGIVYEKTAAVFAFLKDYLGEEKFDAAMQEYFKQWEYKHPQPINLRSIMEASTGKNLGWFFDGMLASTKKIDYKICKAKSFTNSSGNTTTVTIKNKKQINAPFEITAYKKDSIVGVQWFDGFSGKNDVLLHFVDFDKLCINSETTNPEYNIKNNFYKAKGICKKSKPLHLQLLPGIDDPMKSQLCITPIVGFNYYNGIMPGIAIYNDPVPQKTFSYFLMPEYGTFDNSLAGYGRAGFTLLPKSKFIQMIWLGTSASHYAYERDPDKLDYTRIVPEVLVKFKPKNPRSTTETELRFRNFNVSKDIISYDIKPLSGDTTFSITSKKEISSYYVNQLTFSITDKRIINPYSFKFLAEQGDKFMKASVEGNYKITYNKPRKSFDIRAFFGDFLYSHQPIAEDFRFNLSGMQGINDYLYDHYFIGRNEGSNILSQQFCETDGGFKVPTIVGQTWNGIFSINLKTSIPGNIPIKLFTDIGTVYDKLNFYGSSFPVFFDAGIQLSIINNIFDIYFPLLMSDEIKHINKLSNIKYVQTIRFTFSLEKIDPFKLLRDIR
jgi:hypothetical protein